MADDTTILRLRKQWDAKGWNIGFVHLPGTNQPDITIDIPIEDFKRVCRTELEEAIKQEIGSITWTVTASQFAAKLEAALDTVFDATIDGIIDAAKREVKPT